MRVNQVKGNTYYGKMILGTEELRYEGETHKLVLEGRGRLLDKQGKLVYFGSFKSDLPHGDGLIIERQGKSLTDAFHGYFHKGLKQFGSIEEGGDIIEGIFILKDNRWRMKDVQLLPSLQECI